MTEKLEHTSTSSAEPTPPKITAEELAMIEEMRARMGIKETVLEHLNALSLTGETEKLENELEDIAYTLMEGDDEYIELLAQFKQNPNDKNTVGQINAMSREYKKYIRLEAGLSDESLETAIQNSSEHVKQLLAQNPEAAPLETLGILQPNQEGRPTYRFPVELVPNEVADKWSAYLSTVYNHLKAVDDLRDGGDKQAVVDKDRIRKNAHDAVTRDMTHIVGENIGYDFTATRQLLATIRDHELGTHTISVVSGYDRVRANEPRYSKQAYGLAHAASVLMSDHK